MSDKNLPPGMSLGNEVIDRSIENEMRDAYLDYAMSVIVGRALPDVRDGLKPVHRRVLYAMRSVGNDHSKPYKKSARIVGDVLGRYHPHGQDAVYDALVRMAQPFSLRYLLVDGQGNFGSVDGDAPAAMRYTEIRLTRIAGAMMTDIDKDTVDMVPNYDGSEKEPTVLCPIFPSLVVNGSSGIAVGMATNIPPHNLGNAVDACQLLLRAPDSDIAKIIDTIIAPDFPTGGIIHGMNGVREAYLTGRGRVVVRACVEIEKIDRGKRSAIVVSELPYMVNKAHLVEKIAHLARDKAIEGISDLRDESDRRGMRVVIELRRDVNPQVLLNNLYKSTDLQSNFSVNMVALVHGTPRTLNILDMLKRFLEHRREIVYRRSVYELERARGKAHNLEGLAVAVGSVEEIVALIKKAASPATAKTALLAREWECATVVKMLAVLPDPAIARPSGESGAWGLFQTNSQELFGEQRYRLSPRQAQAILEMRLQRLTAIERDKVIVDYRETVDKIVELLDILDKPERVSDIISAELEEMKKLYGDKRRTRIDEYGEEIDNEDLIKREEMVVPLSHHGYIKRTRISEYRTQHRGGVGKAGAQLKEQDFIAHLSVANTHHTLLFITSRGRVYWKKVYQLPESGRNSRGRPIVNILPMWEHERVQAMLAVADLHRNDMFVVMATCKGIVKKTPLAAYSRPKSKGIIAIKIDEGDELIDAALTSGKHSIMLFSDGGKAVRFAENKLRAMGRNSRGVIGIKLQHEQKVVSMVVAENEKADVLTVTENGKGKRTNIGHYVVKGRATQGVVNISKSAATGKVVRCIRVDPKDDVMLITAEGRMIRIKASSVRKTARTAQGVKVFDLGGEKLVSMRTVRKQISLIDEPEQD